MKRQFHVTDNRVTLSSLCVLWAMSRGLHANEADVMVYNLIRMMNYHQLKVCLEGAYHSFCTYGMAGIALIKEEEA